MLQNTRHPHFRRGKQVPGFNDKRELLMGMRSILKSMISVKEDKKVVIASLVLNYQLYAYVLFYFIIREVWLLQSLTCLFINTFLYRVLYKP